MCRQISSGRFSNIDGSSSYMSSSSSTARHHGVFVGAFPILGKHAMQVHTFISGLLIRCISSRELDMTASFTTNGPHGNLRFFKCSYRHLHNDHSTNALNRKPMQMQCLGYPYHIIFISFPFQKYGMEGVNTDNYRRVRNGRHQGWNGSVIWNGKGEKVARAESEGTSEDVIPKTFPLLSETPPREDPAVTLCRDHARTQQVLCA